MHIAKVDLPGPYRLDAREVPVITAFLFHNAGDEDPRPLGANANKSFQGSIILGMGFTFDDTDKKGVASPISLLRELIARDPRNAERIFPFIGGEEVTDSPTHAYHRQIISFDDFPRDRDEALSSWFERSESDRAGMLRDGIVPVDYPEPVAADWPDLFSIVKSKVKPVREDDNRESYRRYWWRYAERRGSLYALIGRLDHVLVGSSKATPHHSVTFLPPDMIFSQNLNVFTFESHAAFAAISTRAHEVWARFFGTTFKTISLTR